MAAPPRLGCADDVQILCEIYRKRALTNPRSKAQFDLSPMSHPDLYAGREPVKREPNLHICSMNFMAPVKREWPGSPEPEVKLKSGAPHQTLTACVQHVQDLRRQLDALERTFTTLRGSLS